MIGKLPVEPVVVEVSPGSSWPLPLESATTVAPEMYPLITFPASSVGTTGNPAKARILAIVSGEKATAVLVLPFPATLMPTA